MSSIKSLEKQQIELACLSASEAELVDGTDKALEVLGPPTDSLRMKTALGILVRAGRYPEASDMIANRVPHRDWIPLGAFVFARLGKMERGHEFIDISDQDGDAQIMRNTRLAFAEGVVERLQEHTEHGSFLAPKQWSESEKSDMALTAVALEPLVSQVRSNRSIKTEQQLEAITFAVFAAHVTADKKAFDELIEWLVAFTPVPLVLGELCIRGIVAPKSELPTRLRIEHVNSFQASFLAAIIERELLDKTPEAFDALVALSNHAKSEEEKDAIKSALFETSIQCGNDKIEQAITLIRSICPSESRLIEMLQAFKEMRSENVPSATSRLEALRDDEDSSWWQAYAQLCELSGNDDEARKAWEMASDLLPHPDLVRRAAQASLDRRAYHSAVKALQKLVQEGAAKEDDYKALAWALAQLREYSEAADVLNVLKQRNPVDIEVLLSLSQCLARSAQVNKAVGILDGMFEKLALPLDAYFLQAQLLIATDHAVEAFELLDGIAADQWDEPRFLLAYMNTAYSAAKEREAFDAFSRLISLRSRGQVPEEYLQSGSLEQLLEYGEDFRNRRESFQKEVISGRLPWLFVEDVIGNPPHWAWQLHTQNLNWLPDNVLARASYAIYATNGFAIEEQEGVRRLQAISGPEPGGFVVADLSALLTLDFLGRLEQAADFFGGVILPSSYGDLPIRDGRRYGLHQPSQEQELAKIRKHIALGNLEIASASSDLHVTLDEYLDDPLVDTYRIRDLLELLETLQAITAEELVAVKQVAHQPALAVNGKPTLKSGMNILVSLHTLRTLAGQAVFEQITNACKLYISSEERDQVESELLAFETSRNSKTRHDEFWSIVASLIDKKQFSWSATVDNNLSSSPHSDEDDKNPVTQIESVELAVDKGVPLLADDRVLQVMHGQSTSHASFGTYNLLEQMVAAGSLSNSDLASDFHELMQKRYRFLVPTPEILMEWAINSRDRLPGGTFIDAAVYLHESLRDPGLFCGLEESDPPMPMAAKLVLAWMDSITKFLASLWSSKEFSDAQASRLTLWVGEEMIPSCPPRLWYERIGFNLANCEAQSLLSMAMVQFAVVEDADRASLGLRVLASAMGLTEDEFAATAVEVIDGTI